MGAAEMEQFLNYLAVQRKVAASTQKQALSALVFLYREILRQDFEWMENLERAKRPAIAGEGPRGNSVKKFSSYRILI
jgi:hypothetical protein